MRNLLILITIMVLMLSGCGNDSAVNNVETDSFAVIKDDIGREVKLANKPTRIVVTSASFLEPLNEVGGTIVGRPDSKTNMPEWAKDIASIGHVYNVDVEKVIACNPDLVIINKGMNEKLVSILDENKVPSLVIDMKSYDDVKREIKIFSQITGNIDKGKNLIDNMDSRIKEMIDRVPKEKLRVAILHSTAQGLSVQLEGSIAGNIVKMFNWQNVAEGMTPLENNPDAAPYSMETLAQQNPEIIFITSMGKIEEIKSNMQQTIETNPAWQSIGAVKSGKLYYLPQDLFLLSPGLKYPDAVEFIAKIIYPNLP